MKKILLNLLFLGLFPLISHAQSSLYLPAGTNWVSVGDLDVPGDQLTVEALIHYTGTSINIVSKHTGPPNVNYLLRIGLFEITTTNGYTALGDGTAAGVPFVPNKTYHVAATYDGQFLRYYVNGCLAHQKAWTGNMIQNNLITAIGNQSNCQCEPFMGYIDEVRIWNVARTQAQIAANMLDLPAPATQAGLMGYWKFDGNHTNLQGNTAFNGTPVGAPQFQLIPYPLPAPLYASSTFSNPVCGGEATGLINASSSGYYTPHEYSLDGINYSTSPVFPNLPSGNYTVYIRPQNNNNCLVTRTVTLSDPPVLNANLNTTQVSCFGGSNGTASVAPSGGNGPNYSQLWYPQSLTTVSLNNLSAGNYSVVVSDSCKAGGPELVNNGTFDNGASAFNSDYTHCLDCIAGGNDLNEGQYLVVSNASVHHSNFIGTGNGGGGNFLNVNGGSTPNANIWCQSIAVSPNTWYFFSTWVTSLHPSSPANLQFSINGNVLGVPFVAPSFTGQWIRFFTSWFSGSSASALICIVNQNTALAGNDFGLDDISFKECISCEVNVPYVITEPTSIQIPTLQNNVTCAGSTTGNATANPIGGIAPYTYSWNTVPAQTTPTASTLSAGTYTVTVTDNNACSQTASVSITEPAPLQLSTSQTNVPCAGGNAGSATVNPTGGTGPYAIVWNTNPVQTTPTVANLSAGAYTVTVTDALNCTQAATVTIVESSAIQLSTTQNDVSCSGGNNGSATVNPFGGNGSYSFNWNTTPAQTAATAINLVAGTYTVTITDAQNCTQTATVTIAEPAPLLLSAVQSNVTCAGGSAGSATAIASGGTGNFSYSWNTAPVQTAPTATGLVAGTYMVTVTDALNCSQSTSITITEPTPFLLSALKTNVSCSGGSDGSATVNPVGGTGPFSYSWSTLPPQTTQSAIGLPAGTYTVIVTDALNCTETTTVTITEPAPLQISTTQINVACAGGVSGSATLNVTGGSGNYGYLWNTSPIQNTATAANLSAGTYSAIVTDGQNCNASVSVTITETSAIQLSIGTNNVSCAGGSNGSATVAPNGGNGGYSCTWNTIPVQTTTTAVNLAAGTYTVTITDAQNCTQTSTVTIAEPAPLQLSAVQSNVTCAGGSAGSATAIASGGTGSFSYSWNTAPVQTAPTATGLVAGTYMVTVTDALNCSQSTSITITEPTPILLSTTKTDVSCSGGNDGSATVNPIGGTGPYSYSWNTPSSQVSQNATGLSVGTYTVVVTDALSCTETTTVTIAEPAPIQIATQQIDVSCHGGTNGTATALPSGGTGLYSYSWNTVPPQSTQSAGNLSAGPLTVTVSDLNGCTLDATLNITEPQPLQITYTQNNVTCSGGNDGQITLNVNGGISPYAFVWSTNPAQSSSLASNLTQGVYSVTVTDLNACTLSSTFIISEPPPLVITVLNQTDPRCVDSNDGSITVVSSGGTGGLNYSWIPAVSSSSSANSLSAGNYQIIVTDANSCSQSAIVTLQQPDTLVAWVSANPSVVCAGQSTSLSCAVTGGTGPLTYSWSNGSTQPTQTVLPVTSMVFSVTVTDSLSCSTDTSTSVSVVSLLIDLGSDTSFCWGNQITLDAGSGFANYQWQDGSSGQDFQVNQSGTYYVHVIDTNGCEASDTLVAIVNALPEPGLPALVEFCPGSSLSVNAYTGFTGYSWSTGETSVGISINTATSFILTVTDSVGCSGVDTVVSAFHPVPVLAFDIAPLNGCAPLDFNIRNLTTLNGSIVTSWEWTTGDQSSTAFEPGFSFLNPGLYSISLLAFTSDGCRVDTLVPDGIEVYPVPVAQGVPSKITYEYFDNEIIIFNTSVDATTYQWSIENNSLGSSIDLYVPITDSGNFVFELVATNIHGCSDTAFIPVRVLPGFALYFPNAFTPNGNDVNEWYAPKGVGIKDYRLQIFNRWGELVFESDAINEGWDGTCKGQEVPQDTYVYKCEAMDFRGKKYGYAGKVQLCR